VEIKAAMFSSIGNNMYWITNHPEDGKLTWFGYDDTYWWKNISETDEFRIKVGPVTGNTYKLNAQNNILTITEKDHAKS
jgi:hypothetical protein